jgi:outer membrane protein OmpA-like peptidoglycan-associated protein
MNTSTRSPVRFSRPLAAILVLSIIAAGCATAPISPAGSADVRGKLSQLQADTKLATLAPVEIREAEAAVQLAETPVGKDEALGRHRVYVADRKVEIAMAKASTRFAEEQRIGLSQARDEARLAARTREADKAHRETAAAQSKADAVQAKAESDAAEAARSADKLQRQIDELKAEATDRGLVLTLGHTLFDTGRSDLKPVATTGLDKLVVFLNDYPERSVAIEGHTDDVGSVEMNQTLSQLRADSVKSYLVQKGIQSGRIVASGIGETQPIADNQSASGRQQNRRVEIIIENSLSAIPTASRN